MRTLSVVTEHKAHNTNCFVCVVLYVLYSVRMEKVLIHISNVFPCYTTVEQLYGTIILNLLITVLSSWIG